MRTYDMSRGVAGWEPPIVCAKLVAADAFCLVCGLGRLGAPFDVPPNAQLAPLPYRTINISYKHNTSSKAEWTPTYLAVL